MQVEPTEGPDPRGWADEVLDRLGTACRKLVAEINIYYIIILSWVYNTVILSLFIDN